MSLHRVAGQVQLGGDLGIGPAVGDQPGDVRLGEGQRLPPAGWACPVAGLAGTDAVTAEPGGGTADGPPCLHAFVQADGLVEPVAGRHRAAAAGEQHGGVRQGLRAPSWPARGPVIGGGREHRRQVGGQQPAAVVGHGALDRQRLALGFVRRGLRGRSGGARVADGERKGIDEITWGD